MHSGVDVSFHLPRRQRTGLNIILSAFAPAEPIAVRLNPEKAVIGNRSTGQPSGLGAGDVVVFSEAIEAHFMRTAFPSWSRDRESNHGCGYRPKRCPARHILTRPEKRAGQVFPTRCVINVAG
jgi:hypothetical protein